MTMDSFEATAAFDRKIAWRGGGSVRHLVVELGAGERAGEPAPLNLAIALDVSSSMHGDKVETAKAAAVGIVEGLRPVDRLAVSAFSAEGRLILASTAMDEKGRTAALGAIASLQADGNTNLSEGWLIAVEEIAGAMSAGAVSRVVILTDGQANAGIIDEGELAAHAAALRRRGISTSTVGIGDGYAESLLRAIASEGGGQMHDAEKAHEIEEVMRGELDELRGIALEEVTVALRFPPAVKVECLSAMPSTAEPGRARIFAGSMAVRLT